MGITNSIRVRIKNKKKTYKMKFSTAVLVAVASAEDKKVPPRHPLQRLARLTEFSAEILNDWYGFLPSKDSWIQKFANNAERMERNFNRGNQRCGFYDENQLPHGGPERKRRDLDDVDRYISQCSGQRQYQHQVNRMNKWNSLLQAHLAS